MFGSAPGGANAYAKVGIETGVSTASPHALIVMLFDGALVAVNSAMHHMRTGSVRDKGMAISKAIAIIDTGLRASLDKSVGGEIAVNLDALYEYMSRRLVIANAQNDPAILEEVRGLLSDLKGAWDAIGATANQAGQTAEAVVSRPASTAAAYDTLAPSATRLVKA
jgi:flagellar secretion chaperone FliS